MKIERVTCIWTFVCAMNFDLPEMPEPITIEYRKQLVKRQLEGFLYNYFNLLLDTYSWYLFIECIKVLFLKV